MDPFQPQRTRPGPASACRARRPLIPIFPGAVDDPLHLALVSSASGSFLMSALQGNVTAMAARDWAQTLIPYRRPSAARSALELAVTVLPFVALWAAMLIASRNGEFLLSFAMAPIAAGLLVRLFMIQHDCGHGSFMPYKPANDWIGRAIG